MFRGYSWLYTEESLLEVLKESNGRLGIELGLALCKVVRYLLYNLQPQSCVVLFIMSICIQIYC